MRYLLFFCAAILAITGCQKKASPLGAAAEYYPSKSWLREGVVNKYYVHYHSADGYEKTTDIRYQQYRLATDGELEVVIYNPGFEVVAHNLFRFRGGRQEAISQVQFWRGDTFPVDIQQSQILNWEGDTAHFLAITTFPGEVKEQFEIQQFSSYDSLVNEQDAKVFLKRQQRTYSYPDAEDRAFESSITDMYVKGVGLFARNIQMEEGVSTMELVEQIPLRDFHKKIASAPKRVAYIDPRNTLDKNEEFFVCDNYIYDYYNGMPDAGFIGGKKALRQALVEQINTEFLNGLSGYLTFRFVINCKGEAGRFTTEEADLDFQRMTFPAETIQHLFGIINGLDNWRPTRVREQLVDSYAYVTLKLKDGEIIELLP